MARRPRIGDLFEVETRKGLAYFQYCHHDPREGGMGPLIRMIEGLFPSKPEPGELMKRETLFWVYFPLSAALYHKLVTFVANMAVPPDAQAYPTLLGHAGTHEGLVHSWEIVGWDRTLKEKVVRTTRLLSADEERLSWDVIVTFPRLVDWIEEQWRPENDPVMRRSQRHWVEVARREMGIADHG